MGSIFLIFCIVVGLVMFIISIIMGAKWNRKQHGSYDANVWPVFKWISLTITIICLFGFIFNCFKIIDAGEVGVQVKFGRVLDYSLTEGFNSKSPFVKVYIYGIRMKEYTMSVSRGEGDKSQPDQVEVRSKDNSKLEVDGTVWWAVDPLKAMDVYKKVSINEQGLQEMIIRPSIRTAMRDVAAKYTMEQLMKQREDYGVKVYEAMIISVTGKGVVIDRVLIRNISPPEQVDVAIQNKLKSEQQLQQKEFDLAQAKKDAEIEIARAEGVAQAQDIIQQKLTPLYVQYEAIQAYRELAGSNNTTFIIVPTSTQGTGLPIIIDAKGMSPSVQSAGK